MALLPGTLLMGRTVLIHGESVKVTSCHHQANFQTVLVNNSIEISYHQFEKLVHGPDAPAAVKTEKVASDKPAKSTPDKK